MHNFPPEFIPCPIFLISVNGIQLYKPKVSITLISFFHIPTSISNSYWLCVQNLFSPPVWLPPPRAGPLLCPSWDYHLGLLTGLPAALPASQSPILLKLNKIPSLPYLKPSSSFHCISELVICIIAYCCCNQSPQFSDLQQHRCILFQFQRSESKMKLLAGLCSFWRLQRRICFLVVFASRGCLHALVYGTFLCNHTGPTR